MLKIFKKMAAGTFDFTPKEWAVAAPRFFDHFAALHRTDLLERAFPYLPEESREKYLTAALDDVYDSITDHGDGTPTLRWILEKAEQIEVTWQFWDKVARDEQIFDFAVASGFTESVDLLLGYCEAYGEKRSTDDFVEGAGVYLRDIPMTDHLLAIAHARGGEAMAGKMLGYAYIAMHGAIEGLEGAPYEAAERIEATLHILRKQYESGGNEPVIRSLMHIFDPTDEVWWETHADVTAPVFAGLMGIGGNELIKTAFVQDDFVISKMLGSLHATEVMDVVEDLATQTQDQELLHGVRNAHANSWFLGEKFDSWIDIVLAEDHTKKTEEDKEMDLKGAALLLAIDLQLPNTGDTLRDIVATLVRGGSPHKLVKLLRLYEAYGQPSPLRYLPPDISPLFRMADVDAVEMLIDYTLRESGMEQAQAIFLQPALTIADRIFEGTDVMLPELTRADAKRYLDLVQRVGGSALVERVLAGPERKYSVFRLCLRAHSGDLIDDMFQRLPADMQAEATLKLPLEWYNAKNGPGGRRQFDLAYTNGQYRWRAITGHNAPDTAEKNSDPTAEPRSPLTEFSPYRFKRKLYDAILPAITYAAKLERNESSSSVFAYKLTTLFGNEDGIDTYLSTFEQRWLDHQNSRRLLHDACLFDLPEFGAWDPKKWQPLVGAYGPAVYSFLSKASHMETLIGHDPFPASLGELKIYADNISYEREDENPYLTHMARQVAMDETGFNAMLDFYAQHRTTLCMLPGIFIDGSDLNVPNAYMQLLPRDDPHALFLGYHTNGCQAWGDNGNDCVIYGMSNPLSGFYVWRTKTDGEITPNDPIVAQSWAWIGEDNALVFDSYELAHSRYRDWVQPFLEQFAFDTVDKHHFSDERSIQQLAAVRLGCDSTGQTPDLPFRKFTDAAGPRGYEGHYSDFTEARDSKTQYVITPVDHRSLNRAAMVPPLAPVTFSADADRLGQAYIAATEQHLRETHGLTARLAVELEFYAVDADNRFVSHLPHRQKMLDDLREFTGIKFGIASGDPNTRGGQHLLISDYASPGDLVCNINTARVMLQKNRGRYGLSSLSFMPRPFKGYAWSGASLFTALNNADGTPLLGSNTALSEQGEQLMAGLLDFNRHAFLAYAQQDIDYARYWNSDAAPGAIVLGEDDRAGFRLSHSQEYGGVVENRFANANSNFTAAVAATLGGIEYALSQTQADRPPSYPIPAGRREAIMAMQEGMAKGLFKGAALEVFDSIMRQHYARRPGENAEAVHDAPAP